MKSSRRCPGCSRRLPYGSHRCLGCGAFHNDPAAAARRRRRERRITAAIVGTLAVLVLITASFSERIVPAVADWYSGMVIRYVPEPALRLMADDDEQAFFVCARGVVRRVGTESSVSTFAGSAATITQEMEDGRFQIRSYVDESLEAGPTHRHVFTCTLRLEGERWVLEEVEIEEVDRLPTELAAIAP